MDEFLKEVSKFKNFLDNVSPFKKISQSIFKNDYLVLIRHCPPFPSGEPI